MSLVRVNRYSTRGGGRKTLKVKKRKTPVKQEWDNTVHDLTVHRATPEDLIRRHEIHKSKNRALVHWELQEKALRRKWKKQRPDISYLEKRRLSIMKEILSEQYQMQDVLKKSDHLTTVAKDLFTDFPRKRTGFPNVTMAPDPSQGPIMVDQDSVTQLKCRDSVEPQALNEVDNDEEEGSIQSEESETELDNSLVSQTNVATDRFLHQLKEDNSELINKLLTDIQQKISAQSQATPETPAASLSGEQKAALNGPSAVKRVLSKPQLEECAGTLDTNYVVGQVLNSRKQKQLLSKGRRKPDLPDPPKQRKNVSSASTASADPSSGHPSLGIDVLKHMIHDVEREMEEYERWTGREVKGLQSSQGLTGFTLSLVSSLCRLIRYLRESELQLRKEVESRQQMEQVLNDHRELIDALTAEILLLREESNATQARLQQHIVTTDEQLISLTHAIKSCPVISNSKEKQASERLATTRRLTDNSEGPVVNADVSAPLVFSRGEVGEFPQEDLPIKLSQAPNPPESRNVANSFPAQVFEPAVLLTPPRQKSNSEFSPLQDVLRRTVQTRPAPRIPPAEIIEKEQNWEKKAVATPTDFQNSNANEENHLFTQRWRFSHMGEDVENRTQAPVMNLPQHLSNSHSHTQQLGNSIFAEEPPCLGDGQQLKASDVLMQRKDIMTRIAELTLQNSAIKAHLSTILPGREQGDGLQELKKQETGHTSNMTATFPPAQPLTPARMEERIAELNRQSMEARGKLLELIEQQKLISLDPSSSPLSPVLSPLRAWTDEGKRTIEVSVPVADAPESSKCSDVSLSSGINTRRSSGASHNSVSPLNATSGSGRFTPLNPRAKQLEKQNEEGWFALSTHVA